MIRKEMKYKIIANPVAGRGKGRKVFEKAVNIFRERGLAYGFTLTNGPREAGKIAEESCNDFDVIVGIGGDGTLNEIVQGLVHSGKPLGVIPAGSGNDFSKCLNLPGNLEDIIDVIHQGKTRMVDAGKFNDIYFVNGVGIGFDAAVNHERINIKNLKGLAAYFWAMIKTLRKYKPICMKISTAEDTIVKKTFLLAIGNGSVCGGGFKLTPHAKIDDNLLDVNIVDPITVPKLFWHLPKVFLGTIDKTKYVTLKRTAKLKVESSEPLPVHIDGEAYVMDRESHTIEVVPHALKIIGNF